MKFLPYILCLQDLGSHMDGQTARKHNASGPGYRWRGGTKLQNNNFQISFVVIKFVGSFKSLEK